MCTLYCQTKTNFLNGKLADVGCLGWLEKSHFTVLLTLYKKISKSLMKLGDRSSEDVRAEKRSKSDFMSCRKTTWRSAQNLVKEFRDAAKL